MKKKLVFFSNIYRILVKSSKAPQTKKKGNEQENPGFAA
jgi:hypothetical protein